jgi:hypothetical protein
VKLVRSVVLVATVAAAVLAPTAAEARSWSHVDASGDVYSGTYGSDSFAAAPDRSVGDVIGSTVRHKRRAIVMQLRYVDLEPGSEVNGHVFLVQTPTMRRVVTLVATSSFPNGRVRVTKPNDKAVKCRVPHKIDYTQNTATVVVPRSCLGRPRWIKVGMVGASFTGFHTGDPMWVDDALSSGTNGVFSPRIYR